MLLKKYEDFGGMLELPKVIEIEPFESCNLRCRMCHVSYAPPGPKPQINFEALKKLESISGKYVVFGSNFEPTAHPRFADMISLFVDYGFNMDLVTNGTLLTDKIIETMANGTFNKITFSFDGMRKKTYEEIRRNANFEKTLEIIKKTRQAFLDKGKDTSFSINYVLMRSNLEELIEAIDFWGENQFDMLGFIFMVMRDENEYLKSQNLHPILDYVNQKLDEAAEYLINGYKKIYISSPRYSNTPLRKKYPRGFPSAGGLVRSRSRVKRNMPKLNKNGFQLGEFPGMPFKACQSAFTFARILPDGNVRLCDQFVAGNINEESFQDIWFGEKATNWRSKLLMDSSACESCNYFLQCLNQHKLNTKDSRNLLSSNLREEARKKVLRAMAQKE